MAAVVRKDVVQEEETLQVVAGGGWLGGFGNLLRKELGQWWGTRMWSVQIIIWLLIINVITTIVMSEALRSGEATPVEALQQGMQVFLELGAMAISIGIVTTVQGAIVGEKQLGTAAWVMSKPASRPAFILAKLVAHTLGFAVTAVIIPGLVFIGAAQVVLGEMVPAAPFLAGVGVLTICLFFYLTLTLLLGTAFNTRGPIAGIGIGIMLGGVFLGGMIPQQVVVLTPWLLPQLSSTIATGTPLPDNWIVPIVASAGWAVLFTAVALWRFTREEF